VAESWRNHQGRYGEAYFRTLVTAAGLIALPQSGGDDIDGVDFVVKLPRRIRGLRSPRIEVQVKTTSSPQLSADETVWKFRGLDECQFNDLAGDDFHEPRFLVMIDVPTVS
jgi:hypothetical protein